MRLISTFITLDTLLSPIRKEFLNLHSRGSMMVVPKKKIKVFTQNSLSCPTLKRNARHSINTVVMWAIGKDERDHACQQMTGVEEGEWAEIEQKVFDIQGKKVQFKIFINPDRKQAGFMNGDIGSAGLRPFGEHQCSEIKIL
jgi:hypothetical protein